MGMETLLSKGGTQAVLVEEKDKFSQELNPHMTTCLGSGLGDMKQLAPAIETD